MNPKGESMKTGKVCITILYFTMLLSLLASTIWTQDSMAKKAPGRDTATRSESSSEKYPNAGLLASQSDVGNRETVLIDARNPVDYQAGHIPGAIHL